jgi:hypothetical protein
MGDLFTPWIIRVFLPGVVKRLTVDILSVFGQVVPDRDRQIDIGRVRHFRASDESRRRGHPFAR